MGIANHWSEFDPQAHSLRYLYLALAEHCENLISSGALKRHQRLPAEQEFAAECGVSLGTARRAVEELRSRGLVTTLPSKGTFVTDPAAQVDHPTPDSL